VLVKDPELNPQCNSAFVILPSLSVIVAETLTASDDVGFTGLFSTFEITGGLFNTAPPQILATNCELSIKGFLLF